MIQVPGSEQVPQIAKNFGVEHIVFLSSSAIEAKNNNVIGRIHLKTENSIRHTDITWTFLRPTIFMSNTLQWAKSIKSESVVREPFGDVKMAPIDPKDIASVATKILLSLGHGEKTYTLTGPDKITPKEQAQTISTLIDQSIRFEDVPEVIARGKMKEFMPSEFVEAYLQLKNEAMEHPAVVSRAVEEFTRQKARSFKQWVNENVNAFR